MIIVRTGDRNLAENWVHDNLDEKDYQKRRIYTMVVDAYLAGLWEGRRND